MQGALLIDKDEGPTSFQVLKELKKFYYSISSESIFKLGHGGSLDPFATGLLVVFINDGLKLARYALKSFKTYQGVIQFGVETASGDLTTEITARTSQIPDSYQVLQEQACRMVQQPYLQIPPMYSAKKKAGKRLYELARAGIEVEREPVQCQLDDFRIESYEQGLMKFQVTSSSGTYIRTLAQDFAKNLGSLGVLVSLRRTGLGDWTLEKAHRLSEIQERIREGQSWEALPGWKSMMDLLSGYLSVTVTADEARALVQGQQWVLQDILKSYPSLQEGSLVSIVNEAQTLIAIARQGSASWQLERVFSSIDVLPGLKSYGMHTSR